MANQSERTTPTTTPSAHRRDKYSCTSNLLRSILKLDLAALKSYNIANSTLWHHYFFGEESCEATYSFGKKSK